MRSNEKTFDGSDEVAKSGRRHLQIFRPRGPDDHVLRLLGPPETNGSHDQELPARDHSQIIADPESEVSNWARKAYRQASSTRPSTHLYKGNGKVLPSREIPMNSIAAAIAMLVL